MRKEMEKIGEGLQKLVEAGLLSEWTRDRVKEIVAEALYETI